MKAVIVINIILVLLILSFVCASCVLPGSSHTTTTSSVVGFDYGRRYASSEMFSDKKEEMFTASEEELFNDLKDNKLNEDEIRKLIANGTLTDAMVDKFLRRIDVPLVDKKEKGKDKEKSGEVEVTSVESFADKIDAFSANSFEQYQSWE